MAAVIDLLDEMEIGLCHRVNRYGRNDAVRRFFTVVSKLGDSGYWVAMAALLVAMQGWAVLPTVGHIAVTAGVGVLVYKLLKHTLVRERPFVNSVDILCGTAPLDRYSFPSGHTLHAVSFTVMLSYVEPLLFALCAPFALLVALSRVVLGLHYPSDVIVGAVIGASLALSSIALL